MDYPQALAAIEALHPGEIKPGLQRMEKALSLFGHPQRRLKVVHVAGTNGKGSTAAMVRALLTAAGCRTGLFSSPAVTGLRETVAIDGVPVSEGEFAALTEELIRRQPEMGEAGTLSEFELLTALALLHFSRERVDFAVMECGMGGRDDATNVVPAPAAAVLTPVALDHTAWLGKTVEEITRNKCGILKPGCTAVTSPDQGPEALGVLYEEAAKRGITVRMPSAGSVSHREEGVEGTSFTWRGQRLFLPLAGSHQVDNALTAIEAARVCVPELSSQAVEQGLSQVRMPCRQEWMPGTPPVLLDGAHNPHGALALADTVRRLLKGRRVILIAAMLADKDEAGWASALAPLCAAAVCCEAKGPRPSLPAEELAACLRRQGCPAVETASSPVEALRLAEELAAGDSDTVVAVAGSFYLCAALRPLLLSRGGSGLHGYSM